jgi:hypothetical protein
MAHLFWSLVLQQLDSCIVSCLFSVSCDQALSLNAELAQLNRELSATLDVRISAKFSSHLGHTEYTTVTRCLVTRCHSARELHNRHSIN